MITQTTIRLYGFDHHKGYGTPEHLAALDMHGPSLIHRRSFHPMTEAVAAEMARVPSAEVDVAPLLD